MQPLLPRGPRRRGGLRARGRGGGDRGRGRARALAAGAHGAVRRGGRHSCRRSRHIRRSSRWQRSRRRSRHSRRSGRPGDSLPLHRLAGPRRAGLAGAAAAAVRGAAAGGRPRAAHRRALLGWVVAGGVGDLAWWVGWLIFVWEACEAGQELWELRSFLRATCSDARCLSRCRARRITARPCSPSPLCLAAGIGRSGVFCVLDIITRRLLQLDPGDVDAAVQVGGVLRWVVVRCGHGVVPGGPAVVPCGLCLSHHRNVLLSAPCLL